MIHSAITQISSDHKVWLSSLEFYREELRRMNDQLLKFTTAPPTSGIWKKIEHFQNQFIIQRNSIDVLKHDLQRYADTLPADPSHRPRREWSAQAEEKRSLRDQYESFERVMYGLKHEFRNFLEQEM